MTVPRIPASMEQHVWIKDNTIHALVFLATLDSSVKKVSSHRLEPSNFHVDNRSNSLKPVDRYPFK